MRRILAVVACVAPLAACDKLLSLTTITPNPDAAHDAPAVDAMPDAAPMICLADNFDGNSVDATKWTAFTTSPATLSETGGKLVITLGTATVMAYAGVYSRDRDFTGVTSTVEVDQIPAGGGGATAELTWYATTGGASVKMYVDGTTIFMSQTFTTTNELPLTFDAATMKYWRIKHDLSNDNIEWFTSGDGVTFQQQFSFARQGSLTGMHATLQAGTYRSVTAPGGAQYDNFVMTCQ